MHIKQPCLHSEELDSRFFFKILPLTNQGELVNEHNKLTGALHVCSRRGKRKDGEKPSQTSHCCKRGQKPHVCHWDTREGAAHGRSASQKACLSIWMSYSHPDPECPLEAAHIFLIKQCFIALNGKGMDWYVPGYPYPFLRYQYTALLQQPVIIP